MKVNNSVQKETRKITWSYKETKNDETSKRDGRKTNPKCEENGENHLPWRKGVEGMITATPNNSKRIK